TTTMPGIDALAPLLDALADVHVAPAESLPDTGVGLGLERMWSPAFVRDARYGTRCSSGVRVGEDGIVFAERRFGAAGLPLGEGASSVFRWTAPGNPDHPQDADLPLRLSQRGLDNPLLIVIPAKAGIQLSGGDVHGSPRVRGDDGSCSNLP